MTAGAWDHQLFLATIALAYSAILWRRWILLATLFAVGHTAAMAALAFQLVPPGLVWVEPLIAVSIVVMALVELLALRQNPYHLSASVLEELAVKRPAAGSKISWLAKLIPLLVLLFGVVHGLGFGESLSILLPSDANTGATVLHLLAFAGGVELAQVLLLAGMWLVAYVGFELWQFRPIGLRMLLLVLIAVLALLRLI